jgi:hypothetical protein
VQT